MVKNETKYTSTQELYWNVVKDNYDRIKHGRDATAYSMYNCIAISKLGL